MNVYYLGRENNPGQKKFTDFYFVSKKTGKFLIEKKSDRSRTSFQLHRNGAGFVLTNVETEVEYKNQINKALALANRKNVLEYLLTELFYESDTPVGIISSANGDKEFVKYVTKSNLKVEGTFDMILEFCKKIEEPLDFSKLAGFDRTKWHQSEKTGEWTLIEKMNTVHIMNTAVKKIRDYFDNLKIEKTATFVDFQKKLDGWADNVEVKNLVEELVKRG